MTDEEQIRHLKHAVDFYRDREKHYAKLLSVTDGGQYRADWDSAIDRLVRERDEAVAALRRAVDAQNHVIQQLQQQRDDDTAAAQRALTEQDRLAAQFQEERDKARVQVKDLLRFIIGVQWVKVPDGKLTFCPACSASFGNHEKKCFLRKLLWEHGVIRDEREEEGVFGRDV